MLLVVTEKRSSTCKSSGKLFSHSFPFFFQFWTIFCLTPYSIMHTVLGWKKQWPKQSVAFGTAVLFWSSMGLYGYLSQFYVLDRQLKTLSTLLDVLYLSTLIESNAWDFRLLMTGISENDPATSDDFSNSTSSVGTFSGKIELNWMWIKIECIAAGGENWQWYLGSWWVKIHLPPWNK